MRARMRAAALAEEVGGCRCRAGASPRRFRCIRTSRRRGTALLWATRSRCLPSACAAALLRQILHFPQPRSAATMRRTMTCSTIPCQRPSSPPHHARAQPVRAPTVLATQATASEAVERDVTAEESDLPCRRCHSAVAARVRVWYTRVRCPPLERLRSCRPARWRPPRSSTQTQEEGRRAFSVR